MSTLVNLNGIPYNIPSVGETGWGQEVSNYLIAIGSGGVLTLEGGAFTLVNDVNFGPNFGIEASHLGSSTGATPASGFLRLQSTNDIVWRNAANTADLSLELVGDKLWFAGVPISSGNFSFTNANGFTGVVVNPTDAPNLTVGTSVTGVVYGDGTGIRAATPPDFPVLNQNTTGSAAALTTTRSISASGDAAWTVNFNGSANASGALALANTAVAPGSYTYTNLTVDSKGRITAASSNTPVTSFNSRTGAVSLTSTDVNNAMGFTVRNLSPYVSTSGTGTVDLTLRGSDDVSFAGGAVNIRGGTNSGFTTGGAVNITGGESNGAPGADVNIFGGFSNTQAGGRVFIRPGAGPLSVPGRVEIGGGPITPVIVVDPDTISVQGPTTHTNNFNAGIVSVPTGGATVSNTRITATSVVMLTAYGYPGSGAFTYVSALTPGTGFTINHNASGTVDVAWFVAKF